MPDVSGAQPTTFLHHTTTHASTNTGFPLTDTQLAGSYAVISGHDAGAIDWSAYQHIPTLVVLMGGRQLGVIAQQLQATGWPADTPVRFHCVA